MHKINIQFQRFSTLSAILVCLSRTTVAQLGTTSCDHCIPVDVTIPRPSYDKRYLELISNSLQDSSLMVDLNDYNLEKFDFLQKSYSSIHIKDNGYINFDSSENQDMTGVVYQRVPPGDALSSKYANKIAVVGYYADFDFRGPKVIEYNDDGQKKSVEVKGRLMVDVCKGAECDHVKKKLKESVSGLGLNHETIGRSGRSGNTDTIDYAIIITWYKVPTTRFFLKSETNPSSIRNIPLATFQIAIIKYQSETNKHTKIVFNYDKSISRNIADIDDCTNDQVKLALGTCDFANPYTLYSFGPAIDAGDGGNMLEIFDRDSTWLWYLGLNHPRVVLDEVESKKDPREGEDGDWLVDECVSNPCQNSGVCVDKPYNFECVCTSGFAGKNCDRSFDSCIDLVQGKNDCKHGNCRHLNVYTFVCECDVGYKGVTCEESYTPCSSNPCKNDATCTETPQSQLPNTFQYFCECKSGFVGQNCEKVSGICESIIEPCGKFGACKPHPSSPYHYLCDCEDGYSGDLCVKIDLCRSEPCLNGATCTFMPIEEDVRCDCDSGFQGKLCSMDTDECSSYPCYSPRVCVDFVGFYDCQCPGINIGRHYKGLFCDTCENGWAGPVCDQNINDCDSDPCYRGGTCIDKINGFDCICPEGFGGNQCITDVDECLETETCKNLAICNNSIGGFSCICKTGWKGETCDIDINECGVDNHPCLYATNQQKKCLNTQGGYECICENSEFTGPFCNQDVNECVLNPDLCLHSGTCTNQIPGYWCQCLTEFTGKNCERLNPCSSNPCQNGDCLVDGNVNNQFMCSCDAETWFGELCEWAVCQCQHGDCISQTIRQPNDHICVCENGYTGTICSEKVDPCSSDPCLGPTSVCKADFDSFEFSCQCGNAEEGKFCEVETNPCLSVPCDQGYKCISGEYSLSYVCECASLFCSPVYFVILAGLLIVPAIILGVVMSNRLRSAETQKRNIKRKRRQKPEKKVGKQANSKKNKPAAKPKTQKAGPKLSVLVPF